ERETAVSIFVPRKNTAKSRSRGLDPLASPSIHPRSLACLLMGFESRAAIQQGSRDHQRYRWRTRCSWHVNNVSTLSRSLLPKNNFPSTKKKCMFLFLLLSLIR
ncbi:unnamed protein product, partial [Musa acuminata subsp. burmannicoides]